jgi:ligand-binding sensor domain-containing protein
MFHCKTFILALLTAMLCGSPAAALDPNRTLQQFDHTSWTIHSGAPSGINALAQTTDGYLWLGTTLGLYRFDGVTFELYHPPRGQTLLHASIQSLYATREGGLWIGYTLGEATLLENGNVHNYLYKAEKPPKGTVISFLQVEDGTIWAAAASGLGHFSGGNWQRIEGDMHFDSKEASYLFQDREGTLWVTTTNNVYFLAKGAKEFVKTGFKTLEFAHCVQTPDGTIWIEDPLGVVPLTRQMPKTVSARHRLLTAKNADGLMVDRDGTLWEFPDLGGVLRISFPAIRRRATASGPRRQPAAFYAPERAHLRSDGCLLRRSRGQHLGRDDPGTRPISHDCLHSRANTGKPPEFGTGTRAERRNIDRLRC